MIIIKQQEINRVKEQFSEEVKLALEVMRETMRRRKISVWPRTDRWIKI